MISLQAVSARAGKFRLVDISFDVPQGAYGIVIGPAGSGKTTLLETIAGVTAVTAGRVLLGGVDVTSTPPEARRLGIVYQHAYLFPHLNVRRNIAYGAATADDAAEVTERFGLDALTDRHVGALSGGERQLVAIARALARRPAVLLLDEPFSALDPRTRNSARRLVRAIHAERRFTVLQVTHDFAEAGLLGDVAIMLDHGRVVQQGNPEEVFRKPASPYIADFLGAENVFAGMVRSIGTESSNVAANANDQTAQHAVAFTTGALTFYALGDLPEGPAHAVIRAEEVSLAVEPSMSSMSSMQNHFRGTILEIAPAGAISRVTVDANGTPIVAAITARSVRELALAIGTEVIAAFKATAVHLC
jgi:molybdopterin-binding protein